MLLTYGPRAMIPFRFLLRQPFLQATTFASSIPHRTLHLAVLAAELPSRIPDQRAPHIDLNTVATLLACESIASGTGSITQPSEIRSSSASPMTSLCLVPPEIL